jgi:hypothetical protein
LVLLFFGIGIFVLLLRGRRVQLWEGRDHLLLVEWDGYREYYKRFYFRDIQALIVQPTREALFLNAPLVVLVLGFGILAATLQETGFRIFFLVLAALAGVLLVSNLVAGRSCRTYIQTAVQRDELVSLNRLRRATAVVDQLRPLILAAQAGQPSSGGPAANAVSDASKAPAEAGHPNPPASPPLTSPEIGPSTNA